MKCRKRFAAAVAAAALLVGSAVGGSGWTQASWNDSDYAGGSISSKTILPPLDVGTCNLSGGLAPSVTIHWKFDPGSTGYGTSNVVYYGHSGTLLSALLGIQSSDVTTTGPVSGVYTTVFGQALLSGVLGGSFSVGIRAIENGWTSTLTSWTASSTALGLFPTCAQNAQSP